MPRLLCGLKTKGQQKYINEILNIDHYGIKIKSFDFSIAPPDSEMGRGETTIISHILT